MKLSSRQRRQWNDKGYLVLTTFFSPEEIGAVNRVVDARIADPSSFGNATVDAISGQYSGQRFRGSEAPPEVFEGPVKINDLFLDEPAVRNIALSERLTQVLAQLLDGPPMVCNSLNFLWGSQQPDHFDTWYMPPPLPPPRPPGLLARLIGRKPDEPRQDKLAVSSVCLEDVHPDAGPLVYYPGSHKISPYRFSHGGIHAREEEMPACRAYVEEQIRKAGIVKEEFRGKSGDVFIWHGQLLHGGTPIRNPALTRKTLVTHYWRALDVPPEKAVRVHDTGYYEKRGHQQA